MKRCTRWLSIILAATVLFGLGEVQELPDGGKEPPGGRSKIYMPEGLYYNSMVRWCAVLPGPSVELPGGALLMRRK